MAARAKSKYRIFISYRRQDEPDFVHHIYSWMVWHYGRDNVFMDFRAYRPAQTSRAGSREEIKNCDALLAIIGPKMEADLP